MNILYYIFIWIITYNYSQVNSIHLLFTVQSPIYRFFKQQLAKECQSFVQPSESAERKTNRLKRKDLRNACKLISGLCVLFSSNKVRCYCGARHNFDMDLCGTDYRCAIRLHSIANAKSQRKSYFFSVQTNPAGQIKGRKTVYFFDSEPKTSAENCGGSDLSHNPRNPNISALWLCR